MNRDDHDEPANHDGHDGHDESDGHPERPFSMRLPSRLSMDEEAVIAKVIDCAMHVHRSLGPGFLESIYTRAMCIALAKKSVPFEYQKTVDIYYDGHPIARHRVDLVVGRLVIVELKAIQRFQDIHYAQVISYLKATGLRAGLLINFHVPLLHRGLKRIVR